MKCCLKKNGNNDLNTNDIGLKLSQSAYNNIKNSKLSLSNFNNGASKQAKIDVSQLKQSVTQTMENTKKIKAKNLLPIKTTKFNDKKKNKQNNNLQSNKQLDPNNLPSIQHYNKSYDQITKKKALNPLQIAELSNKYKRPSSQMLDQGLQSNQHIIKAYNEWDGRNTETDWKVNYKSSINQYSKSELINLKNIDQNVLNHNNVRNSIKRDLQERFGTVYDGDEILVQTLVDNHLQGKKYKAKGNINNLYNVAKSYSNNDDEEEFTYEALQTSKAKFKEQESTNKLKSNIQSMYSNIRHNNNASINQGFVFVSQRSEYNADNIDNFNKMREEERKQLLQQFSQADGKLKSSQTLKLEEKLQQELSSSKTQMGTNISSPYNYQ